MGKLNMIIEGLLIAKKYMGEDRYATAAEHDQFFLYKIDGLTDEDAKKLTALGWLQEGVDEGVAWDPNEGWFVFT